MSGTSTQVMRAAVVTDFTQAPSRAEIPAPAITEGQLLVRVLASAIHPLTRARADGSHYGSVISLPLIPGIDGVGRDGDGQVRYLALPDSPHGAMVEWTLVPPRLTVPLPADVEPAAVAAAVNPVLSSWIALTRRIVMPEGARVLVLGATGGAGRAAVQVAKHLGATHVTAVGRDAGRLAALTALGADVLIPLGHVRESAQRLQTVAAEVDVVLDYLSGNPRPPSWPRSRRPDSGARDR